MTVELPKDAEGREIPPDVDAPYGKNGNGAEAFRWNCVRGRNSNRTSDIPFVTVPPYPQDHFPAPPDSWKKPLEDLYAAGGARHREACAHLNGAKGIYCRTPCPGGRDGRVPIAMIRAGRALFGNDDALCNLDGPGPGMRQGPADLIDNRR